MLRARSQLVCVLGLCWGSLHAQTADLPTLRAWYRAASTARNAASPEALQRATEMASNVRSMRETETARGNDVAVVQGFEAVAHLLVAEQVWNPVEKLSQFLDWQPVLETSVQAQPNDPDLVMLRMGVQVHAPAFLNYNDDVAHDRLCAERALRMGHWASDQEHEAFVRDFLTYLKSR